jgi:hypothetical protein
MPDTPIVCFCTEKNESEVKNCIRDQMKPETEVDNILIFHIHKSLSGEAFMGRCCGCMDEVEELMVHYTQKKWL